MLPPLAMLSSMTARSEAPPTATGSAFPYGRLGALTMITDAHLRIQTACARAARLTGYDRADLADLHLGHLIAEEDRLTLLQLGTLALVGLTERADLAVATASGSFEALCGEARVVVWRGQRCLLWTFQTPCEVSCC